MINARDDQLIKHVANISNKEINGSTTDIGDDQLGNFALDVA